MKPGASFIVSVTRGMVISGILIYALPAFINSDAIWFAMPVTEAVAAVYVVGRIWKYTKKLTAVPKQTA